MAGAEPRARRRRSLLPRSPRARLALTGVLLLAIAVVVDGAANNLAIALTAAALACWMAALALAAWSWGRRRTTRRNAIGIAAAPSVLAALFALTGVSSLAGAAPGPSPAPGPSALPAAAATAPVGTATEAVDVPGVAALGATSLPISSPAPSASNPSVPQARPSGSPPPVAASVSVGQPAGAEALPGEPNPALTPGATNPAVTQATIGSTICVSGWTSTVRPPSSYTTGLKREQIVAYGYADTNLADYEEDHLIPLELGGAPADPANLWPEPYTATLQDGTPVGARVKDRLENALKSLVCSGAMPLARAQTLIRGDWIGAWRTYVPGGTPVPPPATPPATPRPTPRPTTPGVSIALSVTIASLTSPVRRGGTASLSARTAPGAACAITVVYKSGPSKAAGLVPRTAGSSGAVAWAWTVGTRTTPGSWPVTVSCSKGGRSASASRSFLVVQ